MEMITKAAADVLAERKRQVDAGRADQNGNTEAEASAIGNEHLPSLTDWRRQMSKAEELALQSEILVDSRLEDDAYEWSVEADVQLRMCAAELRRLAQVERELEDLKASIGEPVAQIVAIGQYEFPGLEWLSADHSFRAPIGSRLYAIKEVK